MSGKQFSVSVRNFVGEPGTYTGTVTGARDEQDAKEIAARELGNHGYTTVGPVEIKKTN